MAQFIMPISDALKSDVDLILNKTSEDTPNKSSINITDRPTFGSYRLMCTFFGDDRTTQERFEVEPIEIRKLDIVQSFTENFADEITITVSLMPSQYLQLYDNSRGLKCSLEFYRGDRNTGRYEKTPVITREYLVIFKNKTDIRKKYSKQSLIPDNTSQKSSEQQGNLIPDIEFQLIEEMYYNIRKKKFNFILRNVTVKDAILMVCKICDIKQVGLVDPDNTKMYENFIIPPNMTFDQMLSYIQSYYGVYNKGMGFYLTEEILYVYPIYETNPSTSESAHFYYVGNNYTGIEVTHAFSDDIVHIVLNGFAKERDLQDEGAEQQGTMVVIQDATRIIDSATTISESTDSPGTGLGKVSVSELNTTSFTAGDNDVGMKYATYQPMFLFDNSNPYRIRTSLNEYRRTLLSVIWANAEPFVLKPGYKINYHYDGEDVDNRDSESDVSASAMYDVKSGICSTVRYTFRLAGRFGPTYIYSCESTIGLSLEYTPANQEPKGATAASSESARSTKEVSSGGSNTKALIGSKGSTIATQTTKTSVGLF